MAEALISFLEIMTVLVETLHVSHSQYIITYDENNDLFESYHAA